MQKLRSLLPKSPSIWLLSWLVWLTALWFLSAKPPTPKTGPEIPHLDKLLHFSYFLAGASLLAGFLKLKSRLAPTHILILVTLAGAIIGALDEYHQTFTPGRSGNDPFDWTADLLGSFTGALISLKLLFPAKSKSAV